MRRGERGRAYGDGTRRRSLSRAAPVVSLVLWGLVTLAYLWRPRFLDPITIWPFWFWTGFGLVITLPGLLGARRGLRWAVGAWLLVTLIVAEEPRYLFREVLGGAPEPAELGRTLRIVTINCAGGNIKAVRDALALDPDIIAVQERPGVGEMEALVSDLRPPTTDIRPTASGVVAGSAGTPAGNAVDNGGPASHGGTLCVPHAQTAPPDGNGARLESVWQIAPSIGAAVLARGEVSHTELERHFSHFMTIATVTPARLDPPVTLTVFSVHLNLPALRMDLWDPRAWSHAMKLRGVREESLRLLALFLDQALAEGPVITGGDFNTPGQDSLLDPLRDRLSDSFVVAGRGWPNTITADHPMSRIDGIWVSDEFHPLSSRVVYTQNSDHRMVVADVEL